MGFSSFDEDVKVKWGSVTDCGVRTPVTVFRQPVVEDSG